MIASTPSVAGEIVSGLLASRRGRLAVAASALAMGGIAAVGLANTDKVLATAFATSIGTMDSAPQARGKTTKAISGSEEFWLARSLPAGASPAAARVSPLAAGDVIALGGVERRMKVVSVREVASSGLESEAHVLMVECRDEASPSGPTVRFVLDEALAASLKTGSGARAL